MKRKSRLKSVWNKGIAVLCAASILSNIGIMAVQAGPLDGIGGWLSDRANDVSEIANDAGQAIADSDAGKFIGEKTSAAGEAIGEWHVSCR